MASQDAGQDWWLIFLVVGIFAAGVTIYVGWDEVGVLLRKASLFLSSLT
jgi:hypothetical protein